MFSPLLAVCLFFDTLYVSFLYFSILVMFFKCILICECIFAFIGCVFILWYFKLQFFVFFNFSNVLSVYLNLRVYLFIFVFVVEVLFRLAVFGENLLAGDVHSSVTMDRHVQAWQWIGSICLLTWGLLWASAYSLEAWSRNNIFLLLTWITFNSIHKKVMKLKLSWVKI